MNTFQGISSFNLFRQTDVINVFKMSKETSEH